MDLINTGGKLGEFVDFAVKLMDQGPAAEFNEAALLRDEYRNQELAHLEDLDTVARVVSQQDQAFHEATQALIQHRNAYRGFPQLSPDLKTLFLSPLDGMALGIIGTCQTVLEIIQWAQKRHEARRSVTTTDSPIVTALQRWSAEYHERMDQAAELKAIFKEELDDVLRNIPGRKVAWSLSDHEPASRDKINMAAAQEAAGRRPQFEPLPDFLGDENLYWRSVHHFEGGMSKASLLVGVDSATHTIKKRMVCKNTIQTHSRWGSPKYWRGNLPHTDKTLPTEYIAHRLVAGARGSRFTPRILSEVELSGQSKSYCMDMEYACNGDLREVYKNHARAKIQVPGLFLWLVLQALVETAVIMKYGNLDMDAEGDWKGWLEIVHRDLKSHNVFLDLPNDEHFKLYPRPKVGDFGLAFLTRANDPINPVYWADGAGTPGYLAPEQRSYVDNTTKKGIDDFPLLSHTNVWGIGAIMFNLMTLTFVNPTTQPAATGSNLEYDLEANLPNYTNYTSHLKTIIQQCLSFKPRNRPQVEFLKDYVDHYVRTDQACRRANRGDNTFGGHLLHKQEMARTKINSLFAGALPEVAEGERRGSW